MGKFKGLIFGVCTIAVFAVGFVAESNIRRKRDRAYLEGMIARDKTLKFGE